MREDTEGSEKATNWLKGSAASFTLLPLSKHFPWDLTPMDMRNILRIDENIVAGVALKTQRRGNKI